MKYCCEVEPENVPDLVAVVRCKGCKHHGGEDCPLFTDAVEFVTDDDWFCADGEEKEGGGS